MSIGKRKRFEIFKRDGFTCRYCGRKSPEVILEVDHVTPVSSKGNDNEMNLVTSCFDCNRGKSDRNLSEIITGENPHDKAIELAEKERQLAEYNHIRGISEDRMSREADGLLDSMKLSGHYRISIVQLLRRYSIYDVKNAFEISIDKMGTDSRKAIPYAIGILKNWSQNAIPKP